MWNYYPVKIIGGTEVQINDKKHNLSPGNQKNLVDSAYITASSMNDMYNLDFGDMVQKTIY